MIKFLQVLCYAITFALALWVAIFFSILIDSEQFSVQNDLPGKPLPGLLIFYFHNPVAVPYLFLIPWLLFVGLPLFPYIRTPYWDLNFFLLRFCVFFSLEMFLIIYSITVFYMPWMSIDGGMSDATVPVHLTWVEISMRALFWFGIVLFTGAAVRRAAAKRKPKDREVIG